MAEVKSGKKKPEKEISVVVRVAGTDLNGRKQVLYALRGIKGVSFTISKGICEAAGIDPREKLGALKEEDIEKIEEVLADPKKFGIPVWALNRRRDPESGLDRHIYGSDVKVVEKFDIQKMIDKKSYKGVRHMLGLPVRGQRTKSSFRKGRTVGVVRRAVRIKMAKKK